MWAPGGEQPHGGGLVRQQRHVGLEPDVSNGRGHSQHRRPRPDVRLFDGARRLKGKLLELAIDPGFDTGEPANIGPGVHRLSVFVVPWASVLSPAARIWRSDVVC